MIKEILILAAIAIVLLFMACIILKIAFKRFIKHPLNTLFAISLFVLSFSAVIFLPLTISGINALEGFLSEANSTLALNLVSEREALLNLIMQAFSVSEGSLYIKIIGFLLPKVNITLAGLTSYAILFVAYLILFLILKSVTKATFKSIKKHKNRKQIRGSSVRQDNNSNRQPATTTLNPYNLNGYYGPIVKDSEGNYRRV